MTNRDDPKGDMDEDNLTDGQIEGLLAGTETPAGFESVAGAFAALRSDETANGPVPVSASLGEFVSAPPEARPVEGAPGWVPGAEEIALQPASMSPTPRRRQRMLAGLAGTSVAKLALAATVAVGGITGAHAAGLVDVPLLPDESEPVEVVLANQPAASEATQQPTDSDPAVGAAVQDDTAEASSQTPADLQISVEEGKVTAELGDVSISLSVQSTGGEFTIDIEVDGVSPECEAALEGLEDMTDPSQFHAAPEEVENACGEEFDQLLLDLEDFDVRGFIEDGQFDEFFGEGTIPFLEDFNPEDLEEFFGELEDGWPGFFEELTPEDEDVAA